MSIRNFAVAAAATDYTGWSTQHCRGLGLFFITRYMLGAAGVVAGSHRASSEEYSVRVSDYRFLLYAIVHGDDC